MKSKGLGKGDKASVSGNPIDLGLSSREAYTHDTKLRGSTGDQTERPTCKSESISSDRGTFKSKC